MPSEDWHAFFLRENWRTQKKKKEELPGDTWEPQSKALRRWLQFAGLIVEAGDRIVHPQPGRVITARKAKPPSSRRHAEKLFVGNSKPSHLEKLVALLRLKPKGMSWEKLEKATTHNAIRDAIALELAERKQGGAVYLTEIGRKGDPLLAVRSAVEQAPTMREVKRLAGDDDPEEKFTKEGIGRAVALQFGKPWTASSAERVGSGLVSFYRWLESLRQVSDQIPRPSRAPSRQPTKQAPEEISVSDREQLAKILVDLPRFSTAHDRQVLIAGVGLSELVREVNFEGVPMTVASELVRRLLDSGRPDLFEWISKQGDVPPNDRRFVAAILETYSFERTPQLNPVAFSGSGNLERS